MIVCKMLLQPERLQTYNDHFTVTVYTAIVSEFHYERVLKIVKNTPVYTLHMRDWQNAGWNIFEPLKVQLYRWNQL